MTLADPIATPDFAELLDARDGKLYELIDGDFVEKTMSALSIWIATETARHLGNHVSEQKSGWVFVEQTIDCFPWRERHMRRPDVCYVTKSRLPTPAAEGFVTVAPDLCVEVISPNDNAYEVDRKTQDYFRAGVALVWHVFPETRTIYVFRPDGNASVLREGQTLTAGDVLPGFEVAVSDLFPPLAS